MKVENPVAFHFIMQDELYLLNKDKDSYSNKITPLQPIIETAPVSFNYLGENKKRFLIVVHYPALDFMDEKHLSALESTIKRLGFSIEDTAIFNRANYNDVSAEHLFDFFKPKKMLLLGAIAVPPNIEGLSHNKPMQLNNCKTLLTFSFDEMMDNTENKKAFWEQMKQL
ncbi:MAG: hypothetical protein JWQ63_1251 [Mucilaginibacter sp.]|nr:hypothetical protein [Mucilaginibacter sp.]